MQENVYNLNKYERANLIMEVTSFRTPQMKDNSPNARSIMILVLNVK